MSDLKPKGRLDEKELVTLAMYNTTAPKWASTSDGVVNGKYLWGEEMEMFHKLAERVPLEYGKSRKLIEIGSGTGRDAKLLAPKYYYIGTDVSQSFIDVSRTATAGLLPPSAAFCRMSVYELAGKFPPGYFDLFWCCATLLHCTKSRMQEALASISSVLKPGGIGFISLKEGDGEELDHYDGLPRYFFYWRQEEFANELAKAGFEIIEVHTKPARIPFLCFFVQKKLVFPTRDIVGDWEYEHGPNR
jgi:SAM-dependent methyltransferase